MKRLIWLLPILLILTSCSSLGIVNEVITPTNSTTTVSTTDVVTTADPIIITSTATTTTTTTTNTPLVIKTPQDLLKSPNDIVYPCEISFNNYIAGNNEYLWYSDDKTPVFIIARDVLCVEIYNANDYNAVFNLTYENINSPETFQGGTIEYQPETQAQNWVTIKYPAITLLPHQLLGIPITLDVPYGTVLPSNWEFDINVADATNASELSTQEQVRCLVNMMQP